MGLFFVKSLVIFPQFEILDFPEWSDQIDGNFRLKVLMYTLFLSNLAIASIFPIPYVIHVWSIGVEEQFYLLWPFLVKHFKKTFRLLIGIIVIYLILAKGFMYLNDLHEGTNRLYQVVADFLKYTRIDCMAIGGIGGYAVYLNQTWVLNFIYQKSFQIGLYVVTILLIFTQLEFGYFTHEVYAIVFCLIILNIGNNKNTFFQLEHPTFKYLGKISYGLYMYNYLCVRLAMIVVQYFYGENVLLGLSGNVLLYILSIAFTIGLSALSYEYFEKPFLRFKHRFTIIKSGETFRGNDNLLF